MRRRARVLGKALWALADRDHPVLAHVVPVRRCATSLCLALGFASSVGIVHDGRGQLWALGEREMRVYEELKRGVPRIPLEVYGRAEILAGGRP